MSGVFEALRRSELERSGAASVPSASTSLLEKVEVGIPGLGEGDTIHPVVSPAQRLVAMSGDGGLGREKFRLLATRFRHLRQEREMKKLLITSAGPEDGKSFTAANLALSLAHHPREKTLLLDGDLRQPQLCRSFGLKPLTGISDWLGGSEPIGRFLRRVDGLQLWFLPAGSELEHPLELLQAGRIPALLDQLAAWFDWIIIDSPPMLPLADASFWARLADSVLVVVRQGRTSKRLLQKGLEVLDHRGPLNLMLNEVAGRETSTYYRYYNHINHEHNSAPKNDSAA